MSKQTRCRDAWTRDGSWRAKPAGYLQAPISYVTTEVGVEPSVGGRVRWPGKGELKQAQSSEDRRRRTEDWIGERGAFSYSKHRTSNFETTEALKVHSEEPSVSI